MYNYAGDIGIRMDILPHLEYLETLGSTKALIVELGVQYGNGSTLALMNGLRASAADPKLMISVDIDDQISEGRRPVEEYWHFILGNSATGRVINDADTLVDATFPGIKKIDVIFIDSFPKPYHVIDEINAWLPMADANTIWLFHDAWNDASGEETDVSLAVREWAGNNGYNYDILSQEAQGLSIMTKLV